MGLFNSLDVTVACPSCQAVASREIQFRYGAVWQYRYHLGDVLRWGRNDVGDRAVSDVVVDAWLCECPHCDQDGRIAVYVQHNALASVGSVDDVPMLGHLEWLSLTRGEGGAKSEPHAPNHLGQRALSYDVVGGTAPAAEQWRPPGRWRAYEHTVRIGAGPDLWDAASSVVLSWGIKTRSGFAVYPPLEAGRRARQGERYWLVARLGPVRVREPVEIVTMISTHDRAALAYGTLKGHPVSGEEAFIVHRDDDGNVSLTLRSLTRPGQGPWRGLFPGILIAQRVYRRRYLRALQRGRR